MTKVQVIAELKKKLAELRTAFEDASDRACSQAERDRCTRRALEREVSDLRTENNSLKTENASLKASIGPVTPELSYSVSVIPPVSRTPPYGTIAAIKAVRAATGLCLKDAKNFVVDQCVEGFKPCVVKQNMCRSDADHLAYELEKAGFRVQVDCALTP